MTETRSFEILKRQSKTLGISLIIVILAFIVRSFFEIQGFEEKQRNFQYLLTIIVTLITYTISTSTAYLILVKKINHNKTLRKFIWFSGLISILTPLTFMNIKAYFNGHEYSLLFILGSFSYLVFWTLFYPKT